MIRMILNSIGICQRLGNVKICFRPLLLCEVPMNGILAYRRLLPMRFIIYSPYPSRTILLH